MQRVSILTFFFMVFELLFLPVKAEQFPIGGYISHKRSLE